MSKIPADALRVWRLGVVPCLSAAHLEALAAALEADDPALIQFAATRPVALEDALDRPVKGACALTYGPWKAGASTAGEADAAFMVLCAHVNKRLDNPSAVLHWLRFWDGTPRAELFALVLPEARRAIKARKAAS